MLLMFKNNALPIVEWFNWLSCTPAAYLAIMCVI
jgi:hypothetical protein